MRWVVDGRPPSTDGVSDGASIPILRLERGADAVWRQRWSASGRGPALSSRTACRRARSPTVNRPRRSGAQDELTRAVSNGTCAALGLRTSSTPGRSRSERPESRSCRSEFRPAIDR